MKIFSIVTEGDLLILLPQHLALILLAAESVWKHAFDDHLWPCTMITWTAAEQ